MKDFSDLVFQHPCYQILGLSKWEKKIPTFLNEVVEPSSPFFQFISTGFCQTWKKKNTVELPWSQTWHQLVEGANRAKNAGKEAAKNESNRNLAASVSYTAQSTYVQFHENVIF